MSDVVLLRRRASDLLNLAQTGKDEKLQAMLTELAMEMTLEADRIEARPAKEDAN